MKSRYIFFMFYLNECMSECLNTCASYLMNGPLSECIVHLLTLRIYCLCNHGGRGVHIIYLLCGNYN